MSDVTFGTWSVATSPITIEYSLVVIEEIRHVVAEGFQKLSRGGIEVGGVLYGIHEGNTVRIMAIRPSICEHSSGPAFRLSERDRVALRDQIRQDLEDPKLQGLACVGWYVSHTRTEISLTESDQEIFTSFFAQPWQVTLVVRPSRGGNMRAGFFVWEPDGTVTAGQSYLEFSFPDRLASAIDHRMERRSENPERRMDHRIERRSELRVPFREPAPEPATDGDGQIPAYRRPPRIVNAVPVPAPEVSSVVPDAAPAVPADRPAAAIPSMFREIVPTPPKRGYSKRWVGAVAIMVVIISLIVAGGRYYTAGANTEPIVLSVLEREGQLDVQWDRNAAPIAKALRASLEITDGAQTRTVPLSPVDLTLGKFSYKRETGDIQVRMTVDEPDGSKVPAASRFLGPPPSKRNDEELKTLQERRSELEAQVERLKQSNDQQAQRIQQLERTLKILQTRPGAN